MNARQQFAIRQLCRRMCRHTVRIARRFVTARLGVQGAISQARSRSASCSFGASLASRQALQRVSCAITHHRMHDAAKNVSSTFFLMRVRKHPRLLAAFPAPRGEQRCVVPSRVTGRHNFAPALTVAR
jgi:hypothetical protein